MCIFEESVVQYHKFWLLGACAYTFLRKIYLIC